MSTLNIFLTSVFLFGLIGLALIYGRPEGSRYIDELNRFITITLKMYLVRIFGHRFLNFFDYIFNRRNPVTLILYLVLLIGGYTMFVFKGYPHVSDTHRFLGFFLFCASLFFFLRACTVDPGIIHKNNHKECLSQFPFDEIIFFPSKICTTCKMTKPARSKHCSVCNVCVSRFDHHCIWINQCVGYGNAKHFHAFLFFNNLICLYGGFLGISIFRDIILEGNLLNTTFRDAKTSQQYPSSYFYVGMYLLGKEPLLVYITLFSGIMGIFLLAFSYYHFVKLAGITTNESAKLGSLAKEKRAAFRQIHCS